MDPDQRAGLLDRLGAPAYLDRAGTPRVDAGQVVDDDRRAARAGDVAELLRAREVAPADVDRVAKRPTRRSVRR
jgi:hypothetical protein